MPALLEVEHLSTQLALADRTVYAVDDISFSVAAGETLGVVGESGSGKSMTGFSIMRLLPDGGRILEGSVRLDGRELTGLSEKEMRHLRGNEIGMIFQDPMTSLNPTTTIGRQIAEPLRIHSGMGKVAARERALELLDLVGVPRPRERVDSYPHQLSGGLRQRVVIAMALACSPKLLIADEPTTALDVSIQQQILTLLERLKAELSMSVLLITHDMGVIAGHADRVLVMYGGRVVETCSAVELFEATRHPYTEALLEALPQIDQDPNARLYSIHGAPPDLTEPTSACRFAPRCRYATETCFAEVPKRQTEPGGHSFECFHPRHGRAVATAALVDAHRPASEQAEPLVVIRDLVKEFPVLGGVRRRTVASVKAVSGVSLQVYRGETLGVVGESGCGKTTLGRMIVALEKPDSGSIRVDGQDLIAARGRSLRRHRRDVQMIFQDPYASLDPRMRVGAILTEPMVVQRMYGRDERARRVFELLADVGLDEAAGRLFPREFSGGQRQRIGFARAIALRPKLIVADEPVSALDVSIRAQLLNLMRRLQGEHDLTYVMISHDLSVVRYLADRVAVMYLGKLVELGPSRSVYEHTAHPYTAGLLESIPVPDPAYTRTKDHAAVPGELPSALNPPSGCRFRTRCPRAQALCAEQEPALSDFGPGHVAACHFPLQQPLDAPDALALHV